MMILRSGKKVPFIDQRLTRRPKRISGSSHCSSIGRKTPDQTWDGDSELVLKVQQSLQARESIFVTNFDESLKAKLDKLEQDVRRRVNELKANKTNKPTTEEFKSALRDIQKTADFVNCQNEFDLVKLQGLKP